MGGLGLGWRTAKLPGPGDVQWGSPFSALTGAGCRGAVCIEVEERALRQSKRYLVQFI